MLQNIKLGFNGRFFPEMWRPAIEEIAFAQDAGFKSLQFIGKEEGLDENDLGAPFGDVRTAFEQAGIVPVMELLVRIAKNGRSAKGNRPIDVLHNNLPAIQGLGCVCVHWHLTQPGFRADNELGWAMEEWDDATSVALETVLQSQLKEAVALGQQNGFLFGIEHNAPDLSTFFHSPERMDAALTAVPDLGLVWDFNHPTLEQQLDFKKLANRVSMLHLSDAPLPKVNWHLPVGKGAVDFVACFQSLLMSGFSGPAILEIGGTPWSGGFGQDSDENLIQSKQRIEQAIRQAGQIA
ncbi:MAG: TIM barrel protein [Chloroflexota bacterium]